MKLLLILKSEPDEISRKLIRPFLERNDVTQLEIYKADVDYDELVRAVFDHDKVICW